MNRISYLIVFGSLFVFGCRGRDGVPDEANVRLIPAPSTSTINPGQLPKLEDYADIAKAFNYLLEMPRFEESAADLEFSSDITLAVAEANLEKIVRIPSELRTFENTIRALDDLMEPVGNLSNRLDLILETNPSAEMRDSAEGQLIRVKQWMTGLDYRLDVYAAVKVFKEQNPNLQLSRPDLSAEALKFYSEVLRDYARAGTALDDAARNEVEIGRKKLDELSTRFSKNISEDKTTVELSKEEVAGVSEDALKAYARSENGNYLIKVRTAAQAQPILENGTSEEARRKVTEGRFQVAMDSNSSILEDALRIRDQVAKKLGYESWADYKVEVNLAGNFKNADGLVTQVAKALEPRANKEIEEMLDLKCRDAGDSCAEFRVWDYYYLMNQLKKEKYKVDMEQVRRFFPANQVLSGMFKVYSKMFNLKFTEIEAPQKWIGDLQLYLVQDSRSDEPLGLIYFDLYPREGKFNHFAQFGINDGKRRADGTYARPVVALVCNFPAPQDGKPSLLDFSDVQTMFHEFGHALHSVLTHADYRAFSGTGVEQDFVEAPSQMLENWVFQKEILDVFAADYEDPSKKITKEVLDQILAAEQSTKGIFYRRQMALALSDLRLHGEGEVKDVTGILNKTFSEIFVGLPAGTNFAASWGHLMGYDASYYSYVWAEVISSDLFTPFKANPKGFMDSGLGMRLRNEIYAVGGSRSGNDSVKAFLNRPYTIAPFLAEFGIK